MEKKMKPDSMLQADWALVVSFLHYDGAYNKVLPWSIMESIWTLADGFGPQDISFIKESGYDWSHVRDSSPTAIVAMAQKIRDLCAFRAHPNKQFCIKCLDSGLHLPEVSK